MKNILTLPLLVCLSGHLSLAERALEAWIYPLSEHSPSLISPQTDISSSGRHGHGRSLPVHAMITLLTDQEAQKRDGIEDKVQELLLELQNG